MSNEIIEKELFGKVILVIEDDALISKVYSKHFVNRGAEVLVASDGAKGLAILSEQKVDLIILDLGMPGLNGYDTLAEVRKNILAKDLPVIVLSNTTIHADDKEYSELKDLGAKVILSKYKTSLAEILEHIKISFVQDKK